MVASVLRLSPAVEGLLPGAAVAGAAEAAKAVSA
jgi:hypothetical protein